MSSCRQFGKVIAGYKFHFYWPSFDGLRTISVSGGGCWWWWWLDLWEWWCWWLRSSIGAVRPTAMEWRCLWWCLWRCFLCCSVGTGSNVVDERGNERNPTSRLNDVVVIMFVLGLKGKGGGEKGGGDKEDWSRTMSDVSINRMSESLAFVWFNDLLCRCNLLVFLFPSLSRSCSSSSSLNSESGSMLGITISWLISILRISLSFSSSVMMSMTLSVSTFNVSIFFNSIGGSKTWTKVY